LTKRSQRKLNWSVVADKNGLENWLLIPVNRSEDRRAPSAVGFQKSPFEYTAKLIFEKATRVEAGEYRCFVDSVNENEQTAEVKVHSVEPDRPVEPEPKFFESMILPISLLSLSLIILSLVLYKAFIK